MYKRRKHAVKQTKPGEPKREFWVFWRYSPRFSARLCPTCTSRTCGAKSFVRFKCLDIFHLQKRHERDIFYQCDTTEWVVHSSSYKLCNVVVFELKLCSICVKHVLSRNFKINDWDTVWRTNKVLTATNYLSIKHTGVKTPSSTWNQKIFNLMWIFMTVTAP